MTKQEREDRIAYHLRAGATFDDLSDRAFERDDPAAGTAFGNRAIWHYTQAEKLGDPAAA